MTRFCVETAVVGNWNGGSLTSHVMEGRWFVWQPRQVLELAMYDRDYLLPRPKVCLAAHCVAVNRACHDDPPGCLASKCPRSAQAVP